MIPDYLTIRALQSADLETALDDIARLRIAVFRDWPYLYDGNLAYERAYLASYGDTPAALLVAAATRVRAVFTRVVVGITWHSRCRCAETELPQWEIRPPLRRTTLLPGSQCVF